MTALRTQRHAGIYACAFILGAGLQLQAAADPLVRSALEAPSLGFYAGKDFRLVAGSCQDCATAPQALWYFRDDLVAVPRSGVGGFDARRRTQDDVQAWAKQAAPAQAALPPLLWLGSPQLAEGRLSADGKTLVSAAGPIDFALTARIASNRSYYDDSSARYFSNRPLIARGHLENGRFIARTLWPADFALDAGKLRYQPLGPDETLSGLVRAEGGGAKSAFGARVLWQRDPAARPDWAGKAVIAMVLNGAQGDDDEAHGGHFAIATGRFGPHGEWNDWLVNNFYNLGSVSEKGIIAATLPMDAYQTDLNSGQSWYRPSYMLVAVLKNARGAARYQEAIGRVFNHFYRQDFLYHHANANCAGISLETLDSLGWHVPRQGPTSRFKGLVALPYMTIKDKSLDSGKKAFDYLETEQTRLYPFVAFEALGQDLLGRIVKAPHAASDYEHMLAEDIEAVAFVRIPQFPSSRAFGQAPVASIDEYMARVPEDRSQWKMVPVVARAFPPELKDTATPGEPPAPSTYALYGYGLMAGFTVLGVHRRYRRKATKSKTTGSKP